MKIGVIGLGLIGGSILKALSSFDFELFAVSKSSYNEALKYTPNSSPDIESIKPCDVIFVCKEMKYVNQTLQKLNEFLPKNTIVTDVSSVKNFIKDKNLKYNFISSHPMAGTEQKGFSASKADLFNGAVWVIEKENKILEDLILKMKARPKIISRKEHDIATSYISHLPLLISIALFDLIKNNNTAKTLASSGFRDMTRLAMGSFDMTEDILKYNSKNIDLAILELEDRLKLLKNMDDGARIDLLKQICLERKAMYSEDGKNITDN